MHLSIVGRHLLMVTLIALVKNTHPFHCRRTRSEPHLSSCRLLSSNDESQRTLGRGNNSVNVVNGFLQFSGEVSTTATTAETAETRDFKHSQSKDNRFAKQLGSKPPLVLQHRGMECILNASARGLNETSIDKVGRFLQQLSLDELAQHHDTLHRLVRCYLSLNRFDSVTSALTLLTRAGLHLTDSRSPALLDDLMSSLSSAFTNASMQQFLILIGHLSKLTPHWTALPISVRESIMSAWIRLQYDCASSSLHAAVKLLQSLSEMETLLELCPAHFSEAIFASIIHGIDCSEEELQLQELSDVLRGLTDCGLSWNQLPVKLKWLLNCALRRLSARHETDLRSLPSFVYSLAVSSFDADKDHDVSLRGCLESATDLLCQAAVNAKHSEGFFSAVDLEQLRIFAQFIKVMELITNTDRIPAAFLNVDTEANGNTYSCSTVSPSKLQTRVTRAVCSAVSSLPSHFNISLKEEASLFNGVLPADIVVLCQKNVLAVIEVDGPHHFLSDGRLRRRDLLKEAMYKQVLKRSCGIFRRIRFDDEAGIGSQQLAVELTRDLQSAARLQTDVILRSVQSLRDRIQSLLSWGLRNDKSIGEDIG